MIEKLLQALIDATSSGNLIWTLHKSLFNSETSHRYETKLSDGTEVYTEITLDRDLSYEMTYFIKISNPDLVDSTLFIRNTENIKVNLLGELVYRRFIKSSIKPKSKSQISVLESIIKSIDTKEVSRDKKISQIIDENEIDL